MRGSHPGIEAKAKELAGKKEADELPQLELIILASELEVELPKQILIEVLATMLRDTLNDEQLR